MLGTSSQETEGEDGGDGRRAGTSGWVLIRTARPHLSYMSVLLYILFYIYRL